MFSYINRHIITGLITILPLLLTIYLVYWFVVTTEAFLGSVIHGWLPIQTYRPGMGVAAGLVAAFVVGLLMHTRIVRRWFNRGERIVYRLPLIKSIYLSIRDLLDYFSSEKKKDFEQVVAITFGDSGMQVIGLVTQTDMKQMPKDFCQDDSLLVYVPMSYGIGGFAVLVPRSATRPMEMSLEDAMRFTLTAGVTGSLRAEAEAELQLRNAKHKPKRAKLKQSD